MKKGKNKKTKKHSRRQKGFTMIELILVITVLGILAVMALPSFYDVSSNAKVSARDGIIGAVKGGINMVRSNNMTNGITPYVPATSLDSAAAGVCSAANQCFSGVLQDPVTTSNWCNVTDTTWRWIPQGDCTAASAGISYLCTYTPGTVANLNGEGNFNCVVE